MPAPQDVVAGFALTGHFLERDVLSPQGLTLPKSRERLVQLLARALNGADDDQVLIVEKDGGEVLAGAPFVANAKVIGIVGRGDIVRAIVRDLDSPVEAEPAEDDEQA